MNHFNTYSIAGYDPITGDLGIAVESKYLAVGAIVPYAEAGVGVIATQFFANPTFGPKGLDLLKKGASPSETIEALLDNDEFKERRQLYVLNSSGSSAGFTGPECLDWCGHLNGENFICAGNTLVGKETLEEMANYFKQSSGSLWDKLVLALYAGQKAGGDLRGQQSAALLVVRTDGGYGGYDDKLIDLRVDDHPTPIEELIRILEIKKEEISSSYH